MVNVASFMIFFSFSSNVTGYYAIFASELIKGNYYQVVIIAGWIFLFFLGNFVSNFIVIHFTRSKYLAHALPLLLEMLCLLAVGIYGQFFYQETLQETEILLSLMLFAMGLQNGLTASISNFAVKTTHLTGITTDLGVLFSMFTKSEFRRNVVIVGRAKLAISIVVSYMAGAIAAGFTYQHYRFKLFYVVCFFLLVVLLYDLSKTYVLKYLAGLKRKYSPEERRLENPSWSKMN